MRPYMCTDAASGGVTVDYEADTAEQALANYIADALRDPWSYNQGEDGVDNRIDAYAISHEDETDRAEGEIVFPRRRMP